MLREIIKPESESYILHIPKEYIDKEVEILVLPFEEPNSPDSNNFQKINKKDNVLANTAGLLSDKNINPVEWQRKLRDEWER